MTKTSQLLYPDEEQSRKIVVMKGFAVELPHTGRLNGLLQHLSRHFLCIAVFLTQHLSSILVLFPAARKRPWLSQNLTNQEVNSSNTLMLTCYARGVPHPDITWQKNGVPLKEGPGNRELKHSVVSET